MFPWQQVDETNAKTLTMKIPKLTEGNQYIFQVAAVNEIDQSDFTQTEPVTAKLPFGTYLLFCKVIG